MSDYDEYIAQPLHEFTTASLEGYTIGGNGNNELNWDIDKFEKSLDEIRNELFENFIGQMYLRNQAQRDELQMYLFEGWQQGGVANPLERWRGLTADQKLEHIEEIGIEPLPTKEAARRQKQNIENTVEVFRRMFPKLRKTGRKRAREFGLFLLQYSKDLANPNLYYGEQPLIEAERGESDSAGITMTLRFVALLFWAAWEKYQLAHGKPPFATCIADLFPKDITGETGIGVTEITGVVVQVAKPLIAEVGFRRNDDLR